MIIDTLTIASAVISSLLVLTVIVIGNSKQSPTKKCVESKVKENMRENHV